MQLERILKKPEYYCRPSQFIQRCLYKFNLKSNQRIVRLPWGQENFHINPDETIGKSILHFGVYDLVITEAIYRLIQKGTLCVDVGANIGYFSSLMAKYGAEVHSYEPHPSIFQTLNLNCGAFGNISLKQNAVSNKAHEVDLYIPENFESNEGIASLEPIKGGKTISVNALTIDDEFPSQNIGLMKIDVEQHEYEVLMGARRALKEKRIANIVFEDFEGPDSKCIQLLRSHGYQVYRLVKGYWNLKLKSPESTANLPLWEPPNYLATFSPELATRQSSWQVLAI